MTRRLAAVSQPHLESGSGKLVRFDRSEPSALETCTVEIQTTQGGTGEASPTNYRKIYGWDGVTINRIGENAFDPSTVIRKDGYIIGTSGSESTSQYSGYTLSRTPVDPSTPYTIDGRFSEPDLQWAVYYYDLNGNWISRLAGVYGRDLPYTFTTPANCREIAIQYSLSNVDFSSIAIAKQADRTTFPLSWSSAAGTVCFGSVDLSTGVLTATYRYIDSIGDTASGATWAMLGPSTAYSSLYVYYNGALGRQCEANTTNEVTKAICTHLPSGTRSGATTPRIFQYHVDTTEELRFGFPRTSDYSTQSKIFQWLAAQRQNGTPFAFTFPLKQPLTYTLTPQSIKTLRGINNIWADCGPISISYWKH